MSGQDQLAAKKFHGLNTGKFFLGVLILAIGLCYLGESLDLLSVNIGDIFQHFWSIFLIFIGLSMLSRHDKKVVYLGLGIAIIILLALFYQVSGQPMFGIIDRTEKIEIKKDTLAKAASIKIDSQAITLKVEGADNNTNEIAGNFKSNFLNLDSTARTEGGLQKIAFTTRDSDNGFSWENWGKNIGNFDLKISTSTPIDLDVHSSASDINVDLNNLQAREVTINSSASNIILGLGDKRSTSTVAIKSAASAVTLRIPPTVGVKIDYNSNISSENLPQFTKTSASEYLSDNFNSAKSQVVISLDSRIGSLEAIWK